MEEIKTKKKLNKKPLIICLVLALVFGIVGFVDIKSNAAELENYSATLKAGYDIYNINDVFERFDGGVYELTSDSPMYGFYYRLYDTNVNVTHGENTFWYVFSKSPIYGYSSESFSYSINGETWYGIGVAKNSAPKFNVLIFEYSGLQTYKLNTYYGYARDMLVDFINGTLDATKEIDYDNLPIDDDMSVIQNLLYNIIRNEKPSENDTTGMGIIKDVEYYEYLTWTNTENLPIQVEYVPIVQVYSGLFSEKFKKEYYGEWTDFEILSVGTNSYTKRTDSEYLFENDSVGKDFEKDILDKYVEWGDNTYLFYGYRMRYVDENNSKCSPWVYAVPRENGTYFSYIEYSDNSTSNDENITGTDNTYENVEDIEDAKTDIDKENEVIQNMNNSNGNIDTSQATNWLYSMVDFIKTTPQMVGVVLAFLPQPILYGMYITIFLGCIASAIAIVKALI